MADSLKRLEASAAHGDAANKEKEVMNWTCDDVIEWARPLFSAKHLDVDALKAAQLDGESLLEMRKNQNLMNALMRDGLKPTVVHKLAAAARELVAPGVSPRHPLSLLVCPPFPPMHMDRRAPPFGLCLASLTRASTILSHHARSCVYYSTNKHIILHLSRLFPFHRCPAPLLASVAPRHAEPKTIFIALSEVEGQGSRITIKDQKNMDQVRQDFRAGGFIDCSSGPDGEVVVRQIEELTGGHAYRMSYDRTDRLTKMEGRVEVVEGTQKSTSKALQADVSVITLLRDPPPLLLLLIPALSLSRL